MEKIKIIFEPTQKKPFLIINKPKGLPSAPLSKEDKNNALSQAIELFPEITNVTGRKEIEYGLLHRIDTQTDGILVIAVTQECYNFINNEQKEGRFVKYYKAECDILKNFNGKNEGKIESYFRPFGPNSREVRPVTDESGTAALKKIGKKKLYSTFYKILEKKGGKCKVECKISEGYRHQVRAHLSWIGLPITGDNLYNQLNKKNDSSENGTVSFMKFTASKIEFEYPRGDLNSYEIALTWT